MPPGEMDRRLLQKLCLLRITPSCQFSSRLRCTHRGVYIQGMQKRAISFRFDQADLDRWRVIAGRSGLTLSEWIRRRVNGGPTTTRVHRDRGVGENERPTSALPKIEEVQQQDVQEWFQSHPGYNGVHAAIGKHLEENPPTPFTSQYQEKAVQPKEEIENSKAEDPVGNDGMDLPGGGSHSAGGARGRSSKEPDVSCKHGARRGLCRHSECNR